MTTNLSQSQIFTPAIKEFKSCIADNKIQLRADNHIIFLFGAQSSKDTISAREIFHKYSSKHLNQYQFLLAEDFFDSYDSESIDLLTLEGELATYTDCVLILIESTGTFAELVAFALNTELAKKILAVNKKEHFKSRSFINLGPLAKVNKVSKFGEVIYSNFDSILSSVSDIESRLKENLRKRSKSVDLSSYEQFKSTEMKRFKLLLISDLISAFGPIHEGELLNILKNIYGEDNFIGISFELSLLKSLGFIDLNKKLYFNTFRKEFYFFNYKSINISKLRFSVLNHYAKNAYERFEIPFNSESN